MNPEQAVLDYLSTVPQATSPQIFAAVNQIPVIHVSRAIRALRYAGKVNGEQSTDAEGRPQVVYRKV